MNLESILEELYATRLDEWKGIAASHHVDDGESIVQDAVVKLWMKRHSFTFNSIEQTDVLIKKEIRWLCLDSKKTLKGQAKHQDMDFKLPSTWRADESDYYLYGEQLIKILKRNKPFLVKYFRFKYFDLLSDEDIMERLNLSSRCSSKARFSDIKRILKHELDA